MNTIEFCANKDRLLSIYNLIDQALKVGSPDFKIRIGQDGSFLIVPLITFKLEAHK